MNRSQNSMQPKISYETVERISKLTQKPLSRGFENALILILDDYEILQKKYSKKGKGRVKASNPSYAKDHRDKQGNLSL